MPSGRSPSVARYLAALPHGLDSHPGSKVKGAVLSHLIDSIPKEDRGRYPGVLHDHLEHGVLASSWYPEIHLSILSLASRDLRFGGDDVAFLESVHQANLAMYESRLYFRLMTFLSPGGLLKRGATNWAQFHRGSTFDVHDIGANQARATLRFPPHLFQSLQARVFAKAFEAALHFNGASEARLEILEMTSTEAHYRATW